MWSLEPEGERPLVFAENRRSIRHTSISAVVLTASNEVLVLHDGTYCENLDAEALWNNTLTMHQLRCVRVSDEELESKGWSEDIESHRRYHCRDASVPAPIPCRLDDEKLWVAPDGAYRNLKFSFKPKPKPKPVPVQIQVGAWQPAGFDHEGRPAAMRWVASEPSRKPDYPWSRNLTYSVPLSSYYPLPPDASSESEQSHIERLLKEGRLRHTGKYQFVCITDVAMCYDEATGRVYMAVPGVGLAELRPSKKTLSRRLGMFASLFVGSAEQDDRVPTSESVHSDDDGVVELGKAT